MTKIELERGKEYHTKDDESNWTFIGWIPDRENPGKKKAAFSRMIKEDRFIKEDDLDETIHKEETIEELLTKES